MTTIKAIVIKAAGDAQIASVPVPTLRDDYILKGDRVWGVVHGSNAINHEDGAFGEVITAKGDIVSKIPDNLSFEEASSLGVGVFTVGQGLYQSLGLPMPSATDSAPAANRKIQVLIYGGSTTTGAPAIQYANNRIATQL
ncbi:hypothetical protein HDU98_002934 [Podochytrium sp. JEL0797]|nr:hypothetical protein HDU98_002934 [Podochytrium sp. JEL0797]